MKLTIAPALPSLSRVKAADRTSLRVSLVQMRWHENQAEHEASLELGIKTAAKAGAKIVFPVSYTHLRAHETG
jgi:hypothetical protein